MVQTTIVMWVQTTITGRVKSSIDRWVKSSIDRWVRTSTVRWVKVPTPDIAKCYLERSRPFWTFGEDVAARNYARTRRKSRI